MRNRQSVRLSDSQRNSSDVLGSRSHLVEEGVGVKVEDFRSEDCTIVVDVEDFHTETERLNVQLGKDSSFGVTDLLALFNDSEILGDFNLTLLNLGGDVQGVEEGNLRGIQTGGTSRDVNFEGSEGTDLSGGGDSVGFNDGLEVRDGGIGEDETDFTLAQRQELFDLGVLGVKSLSEFVIRIVFLGGSESDVDGLLDDGLRRRFREKGEERFGLRSYRKPYHRASFVSRQVWFVGLG